MGQTARQVDALSILKVQVNVQGSKLIQVNQISLLGCGFHDRGVWLAAPWPWGSIHGYCASSIAEHIVKSPLADAHIHRQWKQRGLTLLLNTAFLLFAFIP